MTTSERAPRVGDEAEVIVRGTVTHGSGDDRVRVAFDEMSGSPNGIGTFGYFRPDQLRVIPKPLAVGDVIQRDDAHRIPNKEGVILQTASGVPVWWHKIDGWFLGAFPLHTELAGPLPRRLSSGWPLRVLALPEDGETS